MDDIFAREVQPLFEEHRAEWLGKARKVALILGRGGKTVTVDDVRARVPPPEGCDPRVMGAVFRGGEWQKVGYVESKRKTCHHRPISTFRRTDYLIRR